MIIGREDHGLARTIRESIYIRVNYPTHNRNIGKYILHHIQIRVLLNTLDLNINSSNGHAHRTYTIPTNTGQVHNSEHVHRTSKNP